MSSWLAMTLHKVNPLLLDDNIPGVDVSHNKRSMNMGCVINLFVKWNIKLQRACKDRCFNHNVKNVLPVYGFSNRGMDLSVYILHGQQGYGNKPYVQVKVGKSYIPLSFDKNEKRSILIQFKNFRDKCRRQENVQQQFCGIERTTLIDCRTRQLLTSCNVNSPMRMLQCENCKEASACRHRMHLPKPLHIEMKRVGNGEK